MKTLDFNHNSKTNFYHLAKTKSEIEQEKANYKQWRAKLSDDDVRDNETRNFIDRQLLKLSEMLKTIAEAKAEVLVTGYTPEAIEPGDYLHADKFPHKRVVQVITVTRRDHKGIFKTPAPNVFFEAVGSLPEYLPIPETQS